MQGEWALNIKAGCQGQLSGKCNAAAALRSCMEGGFPSFFTSSLWRQVVGGGRSHVVRLKHPSTSSTMPGTRTRKFSSLLLTKYCCFIVTCTVNGINFGHLGHCLSSGEVPECQDRPPRLARHLVCTRLSNLPSFLLAQSRPARAYFLQLSGAALQGSCRLRGHPIQPISTP